MMRPGPKETSNSGPVVENHTERGARRSQDHQSQWLTPHAEHGCVDYPDIPLGQLPLEGFTHQPCKPTNSRDL